MHEFAHCYLHMNNPVKVSINDTRKDRMEEEAQYLGLALLLQTTTKNSVPAGKHQNHDTIQTRC